MASKSEEKPGLFIKIKFQWFWLYKIATIELRGLILKGHVCSRDAQRVYLFYQSA